MTTIRFLLPTSNHPSSFASGSRVSSTAAVFLVAGAALLGAVGPLDTGEDGAVAEMALTIVKSSSSSVSR